MIFCKTIRRYFTRIHHFGNNGGEAGTALESIVSDGCHAVGDGHGGKAGTVRESIVSDGCHAAGDGHGGKAGTARESIVSDGCHAVGNGQIFHLFPIQE